MKNIRIIDSKSCRELYVILNKLNLFYKLPMELRKYILENQDKLYEYDFDSNLPLIYQIENENTKRYISYLYLKYINDSLEEKKMLLDKFEENEKIYQNNLKEKYNTDNLLKKPKTKTSDYGNNTVMMEKAIIEYKEKIFLQKIFDKIKYFFKRS